MVEDGYFGWILGSRGPLVGSAYDLWLRDGSPDRWSMQFIPKILTQTHFLKFNLQIEASKLTIPAKIKAIQSISFNFAILSWLTLSKPSNPGQDPWGSSDSSRDVSTKSNFTFIKFQFFTNLQTYNLQFKFYFKVLFKFISASSNILIWKFFNNFSIGIFNSNLIFEIYFQFHFKISFAHRFSQFIQTLSQLAKF